MKRILLEVNMPSHISQDILIDIIEVGAKAFVYSKDETCQEAINLEVSTIETNDRLAIVLNPVDIIEEKRRMEKVS